jgi:hypothetical protein
MKKISVSSTGHKVNKIIAGYSQEIEGSVSGARHFCGETFDVTSDVLQSVVDHLKFRGGSIELKDHSGTLLTLSVNISTKAA